MDVFVALLLVAALIIWAALEMFAPNRLGD
jgi:hypothetical protein